MAEKKPKPAQPGICVGDRRTEEELAALLKSESAIEADTSLAWLFPILEAAQSAWDAAGDDSDDPLDIAAEEVARLAGSLILAGSNAGGRDTPLTIPQAIRRAFLLGRAAERFVLQRTFDPLVSNGRTYSRTQSAIASSRADLKPDQWREVRKFVEERPDGVSESHRCKQAASQIRTGTFAGFPGLRIEVESEMIRKRLQRERKRKG